MTFSNVRQYVTGLLKASFINKNTLDKISESNGVMLFDGEEIKGGDLPVATTNTLGGVKIDGTTITIDGNGVISGSSSYTLPTATTSELGGVKPDGTTITVDSDGTIHGASAIDNLSDIGDVSISSVQDGQALIWDNTNSKWINGTAEGGGDSSINGDLYYSYDDYSEEEKVIGRWKDGRPIYRIVKNDLSVSVAINTWTNIYKVSNTPNQLINARAFYLTNNTYAERFGIYKISKENNDDGYYFYVYLPLATTINRIILDYTKDDDAENSFLPSMITNNTLLPVAPSYDDYSTDEIVIGKWVDGKPIYRIVKNDLSVSVGVNTWTNIYKVSDYPRKLINARVFYLTNNTYAERFGIYKISKENNDDGYYFKVYCPLGTIINCIILDYTKDDDSENSFTPDMIKTIPLNDTVTDSDVAEIISVLEE